MSDKPCTSHKASASKLDVEPMSESRELHVLHYHVSIMYMGNPGTQAQLIETYCRSRDKSVLVS